MAADLNLSSQLRDIKYERPAARIQSTEISGWVRQLAAALWVGLGGSGVWLERGRIMMSGWLRGEGGVKDLEAAGVHAMLPEPSTDSTAAASRPQYSTIQCCSYACYLCAASDEGALGAVIGADAANVPRPTLQQRGRVSNGVHKLAAIVASCKAVYSMLRKAVCTFETCLQPQESTIYWSAGQTQICTVFTN